MKTLQKLTALFILLAAITSLHADEKIKIKLHQPPPNKLGVGDMWNLELTNTTNAEMRIYLTGTATEDKDGLIIEGKTKVFTIKPGRSTYKYNDFSGAEIKYNNGKYKEIILRTGNAPEGSYTICVTAFDESGTEVGREYCITQTVQQIGSITLLTPGDGEEIDPKMPINFTWTPLPGAKEYTLRIVELKGDQSPEVALRTNQPIFEKELRSTSYQGDPVHGVDVKLGMKYAWQVSSGEVVSEVGLFEKWDIDDGSDDFDKKRISEKLIIYLYEQPTFVNALKVISEDCEDVAWDLSYEYSRSWPIDLYNSWAAEIQITSKTDKKLTRKLIVTKDKDDSLIVAIDAEGNFKGGGSEKEMLPANGWGAWINSGGIICNNIWQWICPQKKWSIQYRVRCYYIWGKQVTCQGTYFLIRCGC